MFQLDWLYASVAQWWKVGLVIWCSEFESHKTQQIDVSLFSPKFDMMYQHDLTLQNLKCISVTSGLLTVGIILE